MYENSCYNCDKIKRNKDPFVHPGYPEIIKAKTASVFFRNSERKQIIKQYKKHPDSELLLFKSSSTLRTCKQGWGRHHDKILA
ncbi:hypothetical protein C6Y45_03915 [Alkalicoccus saliphilus]|uniref:Uncharacterized protein n=1 Tax=Alkalicoccus saliphilus TaxID=200989 RepID=A0A2T4U8U2_9BACI|nr:hypothetical protein C6Y45_03915 [Alkalicoccus saliphilus]